MQALIRLNEFRDKYKSIMSKDNLSEVIPGEPTFTLSQDIDDMNFLVMFISVEDGTGVYISIAKTSNPKKSVGSDFLMVNVYNEKQERILKVLYHANCVFDLDDVILTLLYFDGHFAILDRYLECCERLKIAVPRNLNGVQNHDSFWDNINTPDGQDFMKKNNLEFEPATPTRPYNRLHLDLIPDNIDSRGYDYITSIVDGKIVIHAVCGVRFVVAQRHTGTLSGLFSQYDFCIDLISRDLEEDGAISMVGTASQRKEAIVKYLMEAKQIERNLDLDKKEISTHIRNILS